MPLKMDNIVCGRFSASQIPQFRRCIFSKYIKKNCHLKLEIALAIPASNDKIYNTTNLAGQGLITTTYEFDNTYLLDR